MTMSAWVTNEIEMGQLILGSGVPEDLNLHLYDIPNLLSFSGHAEDTDTIKDPQGCSPVTRSSKLRVPSHDISHPQNHLSNAFLAPFKHGFHREIVKSATGRKTVYYLTAGGVRLESKKKLIPHIKHLENITVENFNFAPIELPIADPLNIYQSTCSAGNLSRRSTPCATPQGSYQSTDDSAHSAEETRQFREADHYWDQSTCWEQPEDVYIKPEFDPGPYNTEVTRHNEWRSKKPITSSDNTEEEAAPYGNRNVTHQENIDSKRLSETNVQNRILLSTTNHEEIKQEPQEPKSHTQPPQRAQYQREPQQPVETQRDGTYNPMTTPSPRSNTNRHGPNPNQFNSHHQQPSTYHHKKGMPRENNDWNHRPG